MADNSPATLGCEFEGTIGRRDDIIGRLGIGGRGSKMFSTVTSDASVESIMASIGAGSRIFLGNRVLRNSFRRTEVAGCEIVTQPLEMSEMRKAIETVVSMQIALGEIFSPRSSIHLHAGFPKGLVFYKGAVAMGLKTEPLFYKIAGMGREYRGKINRSAYARPLASPPAVRLADNENMVAILSPKDAILAPDEPSFWNRFGGIRYGDRDRYNPLRYFATNVFSTQLRGTMEFRYFNFSTCSRYIEACASLVQMISDLMIRASLDVIQDIEELSIFEPNTDSKYEALLFELLAMAKYYNSEFPMETRDIDALLDLIRATPQPVMTREVVLSHIKRPRITLGDAKSFGLTILNVSKAVDPGIVDIHTFANEDRTLCVN